jgi:hypothetical protein
MYPREFSQLANLLCGIAKNAGSTDHRVPACRRLQKIRLFHSQDFLRNKLNAAHSLPSTVGVERRFAASLCL